MDDRRTRPAAWLIYGLMRTARGVSPRVDAGNAWFTLIGFTGLYAVLAIVWLFLVYRESALGPDPANQPPDKEFAAIAAD
jgi:cytochrome bd ubiquinol oxidase subunit I